MIRLPAFGCRSSGVRGQKGGHQGPEAGGAGGESREDPLGLRPKSVTPVCTSTSGAGNGDAIIASPKVFFVYLEWIFRARIQRDCAEAWKNCLPGEHCNKEDHLVRNIELDPELC